ncbi:hypothetical protein [Marinobacterium arenosum]|uniref:hypothetical protein n=1 Tax=Marinobacterium arenosum TaxID=2862496 RepID=UPI001C967940|nr:hypothetical protein [Marinobacterium arenosum]MBY4675848.1 hypothetical protein [Marinobacterium arenosum]
MINKQTTVSYQHSHQAGGIEMKARTKKLLLATTLSIVSTVASASETDWQEVNSVEGIAHAVLATRAEITATIGKLQLAENLPVERCDVLLEFDPVQYRTRLNQAQSSFA